MKLDTSAFRNATGQGHFYLSSADNSLYINFTSVPEPAMLALWLASTLFLPRRRR